MFDKDHNLTGEHGADLVSYIYGEMEERLRDVFEAHLERCDECAVELGAISDARLGMVEWRRTDFDHLASPQIVLPEVGFARPSQVPEKSGVFAGFIKSLALWPSFAKAGVGLAAAAIVVAVAYFAFVGRAPNNTEMANDGSQIATPPSETPAVTPPQPIDKHQFVADNTTIKNDPVHASEHRTTQARSSVPSSHLIAKRQSPATKVTRQLGTETAKINIAPRLNSFEEDEDKTLRLTDLFSQVGPIRK